MAQQDENRIPGERAETVSGRKIDNNPMLKRGAVALAVVAFVGFALWSMGGEGKRQDNASRSAWSSDKRRTSNRPRRNWNPFSQCRK